MTFVYFPIRRLCVFNSATKGCLPTSANSNQIKTISAVQHASVTGFHVHSDARPTRRKAKRAASCQSNSRSQSSFIIIFFSLVLLSLRGADSFQTRHGDGHRVVLRGRLCL